MCSLHRGCDRHLLERFSPAPLQPGPSCGGRVSCGHQETPPDPVRRAQGDHRPHGQAVGLHQGASGQGRHPLGPGRVLGPGPQSGPGCPQEDGQELHPGGDRCQDAGPQLGHQTGTGQPGTNRAAGSGRVTHNCYEKIILKFDLKPSKLSFLSRPFLTRFRQTACLTKFFPLLFALSWVFSKKKIPLKS